MARNKAWMWTVVLALPFASQAMAGLLIGSTLDAIYDIDPITGVASNPRALSLSAFGIEFADGILYGAAGKTLSRIDPASGAAQPLGTITGLERFESIFDLTWDPQTNTLFGWVHLGGTRIDRLYTIDRTSLAATLVGDLDGHSNTIAFDASGSLYAISVNPDIVSLVDPVSAVTLSSAFLSSEIQTARMVFADMDQLIVSARINGEPGFIFDLNLKDGTLSDIGRTGLDVGFTSLAYIPEPSSFFFLFLGIALCVTRRAG